MAGGDASRRPDAGRSEGPLPPLVANALEGGSGTLRSRLERIARYSPPPGRYTLLGELASGAMGRVLRVWDEVLDRELAMKVVSLEPPEKASEEERKRQTWALERFVEEARITGQLEHPGIVPVHEIATDADGLIYFTMPRVQGETLKKIFKLARNRLRGWNLHRALGVVHKVCQTVAFAHESGVVHRDLKPDNVMVGRFGEVYVMDWGLALILGRSERSSVVGTPAYMSPEQAGGKLDEVGPRSDVYSVGALLYELLSGRMPHELSLEVAREEGGGSVDAILHEPPRPLGLLAENAPPELVAIAEKAMAPEIEDRYASMQELADELLAWLEGRVVQTYDTRLLTRVKKWRARNPSLSLALEALVVLLVGGAFAFGWQQKARFREVNAAHVMALENAYVANLAAADLGLRAHETGAAWRHLNACEERLRGWEWSHLALRADPSLFVLDEHEQAVRAVAVSPDGSTAATACDDGTLFLWDVEDGTRREALEGHEDVVTSIAFHPDGRRLASGSRDRTVRLWDVSTQNCTRVIEAHSEHVLSLAFAPDGESLASSDMAGRVVLTSLEADGPVSFVTDPDGVPVVDLAYDPRTGWLLGGTGNGRLRAWDPRTGKVERVVFMTDRIVRALAVTPDGGRIAVSTAETITLLDAADLSIEHVLAGHTGVVNALDFDRSGELLASGGSDNVVMLWDVESGTQRQAFDGHELDVNAVAFHPDGVRLVSGSEDDTARIWSRRGGPSLVLEADAFWVEAVAFLEEGRRLVSGGRSPQLGLWDANGGSLLAEIATPDGVGCLATEPGGRIAFGCGGEELLLGRASRPNTWQRLPIGPGFARTLAFDAAGRRLFHRSSEGVTVVHDATSGRELARASTPGSVYSLAVHPDGETFATGTDDGRILLWDATSGRGLGALELGAREVAVLAFSPRGDMLAAGTFGSRVYLVAWDAPAPPRHLGGHEKFVTSLAFSPDGRRLVSGSGDLRIWDTATGALLLTLSGHTNSVTAIAFDPTGQRIASASKDGTVRVWRGLERR